MERSWGTLLMRCWRRSRPTLIGACACSLFRMYIFATPHFAKNTKNAFFFSKGENLVFVYTYTPYYTTDVQIYNAIYSSRKNTHTHTHRCLTNLLAGIQDHYTSDQPGMQRMVMHLEELVNRIDADLAAHLRHTGIEFLQFAFKWMNCLLLREFRLSCVMRLWDTYLSEGDGGFEDFHVYVCASFLVHFSSELQQMGFDELFQFMQNMPTHDWGDREIEILLSSAFVLSTLFGDSEAHLNVVRQSV
mmetsp:Transcript_29602/g.54349  ORF Transcript_29602/g.54349 Transcript_29602/m.54349 type:complete len:246 (-) Transcript_29602:1521-2258(-)